MTALLATFLKKNTSFPLIRITGKCISNINILEIVWKT